MFLYRTFNLPFNPRSEKRVVSLPVMLSSVGGFYPVYAATFSGEVRLNVKLRGSPAHPHTVGSLEF